jgi:Uma2 family endonuclease
MNAPTLNLARFTTAEFEQMARTGAFGSRRVELRRGLMLEMNAQHIPHATVKLNLALALIAALKASGSSWRVLSEASVNFGGHFEPMPDVIVWDAAAASDTSGAIPGATVRLIIEVSDSTLSEDLGDKLAEYAAAGLPEYWVADVQNGRILRHFTPAGESYTRCEITAFGHTITALTFSLTVDISALT